MAKINQLLALVKRNSELLIFAKSLNLKKGIVTKSTGSWYQVRVDQEVWNCRIKGKIRLKGIRTTNPVAVGDVVKFEIEDADESRGVIAEIEPRRNYIIRKSVNLSKEAQIMAANIDTLFLVITLTSPKTLTAFIDRFLVTAEFYHIPAKIIINKTDLLTTDELKDDLELMKYVYTKIGYEVFEISALDKSSVEFLKKEIDGNVVMFGGHSGVGKSTLINALDENLNLKTGKISDYHKTGQHTTTFAEMVELKSGGFIVDTPGIRSFGLVDYDKSNLSHYFPEMRELLHECKFNNCQHINEPKCAVKKAYEEGDIYPDRYQNYLNMMNEDAGDPYRHNIYE